MMDISARRTELEGELAALERARGEALLDGGKHTKPNGEISRVRAELEALNIAEGIQGDRARDEAERQRLARLAQLQSELAALEAERLGAVERAEMSCRNLIDAVNQMLAITEKEAAVCHRINDDGPVPTPLSRHSIVSRISSRMASCFAKLKGAPHRFGSMNWHFTGAPNHHHSWVEAEARALKNHLEPLIQGAMPAPREKLLQIEHQKEDTIDVNSDTSSGKAA